MAATTRNLVERLKGHDPAAVTDLSNTYGAKISSSHSAICETARTPKKWRRTSC